MMKLFKHLKIKSKKQRLLAYSIIGLILLSLGLFIYVKSVMAAANCWNGNGATNNWSDTANWSLSHYPTTTELATFGSTCGGSNYAKTATLDMNVDVSGTNGGISIGAGAGTISQGTYTITVGSGNWTQSAGTFTGGSGTITDNGSFSLTGGTFTSTSDTSTGLTIKGSLTISGIGTVTTFNNNSGKVSFTGTSTQTLACGGAVFSSTGTVVISKTGSGIITIGIDCDLPLGPSPTITIISLTLNGTLRGTGTLAFSLSGSGQSVTLNAGASLSGFSGLTTNQGTLIISGATMDFSGYSTFQLSGGFTFSSGSFTAPPTFTIAGTGTFSCGNAIFNTVVFNASAATPTINGDCDLPLGPSPTVTIGSMVLNGTLRGTGTLALSLSGIGQSVTLNAGASLSEFSGLTTNQGTFTNAGATTNLGSYTTVDLNGNFTLSSGTFTAPSGTMTVAGNFTISGGTFNANSGTVIFDGSSNATRTVSCNNAVFNRISINQTSLAKLSVSSDCNLPLGASPTISFGAGIILNGTLTGSGTMTMTNIRPGYDFQLNSGAKLQGFTGLSFASILTFSGATIDFSNYTTFNILSFTYSSGSFTAPPTMTFGNASTANTTINCGSTVLKDVTINKDIASRSVSFDSNCTVGNLTLGNGYVLSSGSYTLSITGNFNKSSNNPFGEGGLTVAMTGSSNQTYTRSTGTFVSAFTVNKPSGTVTLANSLSSASTGQPCTITSGTLDLAGNTLSCASLTVANGGNLQWRGSETITLTSPTTPTLNSGSTVTLTGTSGTNSYTIPTTWGSFSNLTINAPTGTNTFNLGADLTVLKNLTISAGTFDATASLYNVTIGGNFTQNGTMTARNNTFTFNDATQNSVITGTSGITFYNLTSTTASKILKFGAGKTFRTNGALTITGTSKNPVNLSSATSGTPWATTTEKFSNTGFESNTTSWTSSTQTLTLQPNNGTDTEIRIDGWDGTAVDTNYGTAWYYSIGKGSPNERRNRVLIQFDLSSLPDAATISSATLSLYATSDQSDNARTFRVYRLKRAWVETQATWNIFSTGNSWQTAGGFGANDAEQTDIGSRNFTASETLNQFKDFPLTPTTKSGLDLGNGWLIKADTEVADSYTFKSSEFSTNAQNPKLVINYISANRNTSTTYNGSAGSVQLIPGTSAGTFTQSINVGDTNTYTLSAYAYTTGVAVTSSDVLLYANGAAISAGSTTYTSVGGGWYKVSASVTGVASSVGYGVQVQAGKTVYVDNMSLMAGSLSQQWTINKQGTSAITYAFIQDSACDGTSLSIALDGTSRNGGNNGTCWGGYPTTQQVRFKGGERVKGNLRIQ